MYHEKHLPLPIPYGTRQNPYKDFERLARGVLSEALRDWQSEGKTGVLDIKANPAITEQTSSFLRKVVEDYLKKDSYKQCK